MARGSEGRKVAWVWVGLVLASAAAAGCSSKCEGSLDVVGASCKPTFDGTEADLPPCPASGTVPSAQQCGDLFAVGHSDYAGVTCYYDVSSHALVGARAFSDIPTMCGGDSYTQDAGRTPSTTCTVLVQRTCP